MSIPPRSKTTPRSSIGIMGGTGVLEAVSFLGRHFGVEDKDDDLLSDDPDTIAGIAAGIARKKGR